MFKKEIVLMAFIAFSCSKTNVFNEDIKVVDTPSVKCTNGFGI